MLTIQNNIKVLRRKGRQENERLTSVGQKAKTKTF